MKRGDVRRINGIEPPLDVRAADEAEGKEESTDAVPK
jgi:hypothetical protein